MTNISLTCLLKTGLLTLFCIKGLFAEAQAPTIEWDKTFGGNLNDWLYSVQETLGGGYILAGHSDSGASGHKTQNSKGQRDYWIVKLDVAGNIQWEKTIGATADEWQPYLLQTLDGGFIIAGNSNSGIAGDKTEASKGQTDYWVVKLDSAGNKLWDRTFGGNSFESIRLIEPMSDGGYMIGGSSVSGISGNKTSANIGNADAWIVKIDANGNKQWDKSYGGTGIDGLVSLMQTKDGGFILGCTSNSDVSGDKSQNCIGLQDYWVLKLAPDGSKIWDKTIGGSGSDNLYKILQTADNGYILGGSSTSGSSFDKTQPSRGANDYWVVKMDSAGYITWDKTFGEAAQNILHRF